METTTFRRDGAYADHRHPEQVTFTPDLTEDLARRDFTVNAMATDLRGTVYDPFDGQADLQEGILRCVGDPERRFSEDALQNPALPAVCGGAGLFHRTGNRQGTDGLSGTAAGDGPGACSRGTDEAALRPVGSGRPAAVSGRGRRGAAGDPADGGL